MHIPYVVLLLIVVFVLSNGDTSVYSISDKATTTQQILPSPLGDKRLLRAMDVAHAEKSVDNETRSAVSNLFQKFRSKVVQRVQYKTNPSDMFNKLQLGKDKLSVDDKSLVKWLRYTIKYRAAHRGETAFSDYKIYKLLSQKTGESQLAMIFQSLKDAPDIGKTVQILQNQLFATWGIQKVPPNTFSHLLGNIKLAWRNTMSDPLVESVRLAYSDYLVTNRIRLVD